MSHQPTNNQVTALQLLQESNKNAQAVFPNGFKSTPSNKSNLVQMWEGKDSTIQRMSDQLMDSNESLSVRRLLKAVDEERALERRLNASQYHDQDIKQGSVRKRAFPLSQQPTAPNRKKRKKSRKHRKKKSPLVIPPTPFPPSEIPGGSLFAELEEDYREMQRQQLEKDNQELEPLLRIKPRAKERVAHIHPHPEVPANQQEYMIDQELYADMDKENIMFNKVTTIDRSALSSGGLHVNIMDVEASDVRWHGKELTVQDIESNPEYEEVRAKMKQDREQGMMYSTNGWWKLVCYTLFWKVQMVMHFTEAEQLTSEVVCNEVRKYLEKERQQTKFYTFAELARLFPPPTVE